MKNMLILLFGATLMLGVPANLMAQKKATLTVSWVYTNVVEGYDHDCKTQVWVDGEMVKESSVKKESQKNSVTIELSKGSHDISVVNWALYEGEWEEHTKDNNYSLDATYEGTHKFKKKHKLDLVFDIDAETATSKFK